MIDVIGFPINTSVEDDDFDPDWELQPQAKKPKRGTKRQTISDVIQRIQMFNNKTRTYKDYRDMQVMRSLYNICSNLKIEDPERIYKLFLERLKSRSRLERNDDKLELLAAVLCYLDKRISNINVNISDAINKIPANKPKIHRKSFVKEISKICHELKVSFLPVTPNIIVVRDMLDELLFFIRNNDFDRSSKTLYLHSPTVNKIINKLYNMEQLDSTDSNFIAENTPSMHVDMKNKSDTIGPLLTDIASLLDTDDQSNNSVEDNENKLRKGRVKVNEYRTMMADKIDKMYDTICDYIVRLIVLCHHSGIMKNTDILNANERLNIVCKKTFLASIIKIVLNMFNIKLRNLYMLNAWKIVPSTFYRNGDILLTSAVEWLHRKYEVVVNSKVLILKFLKHILDKVDPNDVECCANSVTYECRKEFSYAQSPIEDPIIKHVNNPTYMGGIPEVRMMNITSDFWNVVDDRLWKEKQASGGSTHVDVDDNDHEISDSESEDENLNESHLLNKKNAVEKTTKHDKIRDSNNVRYVILLIAKTIGMINMEAFNKRRYQAEYDSRIFFILTYLLNALEDIRPIEGFKVVVDDDGTSIVKYRDNTRIKNTRFSVDRFGKNTPMVAWTFAKALSSMVSDERVKNQSTHQQL
ncbi:uncharacterized protein BBOV_IV010220 [Babesia bovis T2Bo]|uniref:Uncharacterized protein n=1 Tax=Babesia bovis TaxID=5865 RepID=A7AS57_BABBO|nr:uncharacterized protein BBOV_IV010220 [Babesia bovis T2Bo]EDO07376.1 hypothetical protein BBOV_IV010220 [Babesia bovis T2Bo]|eukprot:XP_001610944.1 hypothetical protein [Babesia bovis T2Bo]